MDVCATRRSAEMTVLGVVGCGTIATAVIRGIGRSSAAKARVSRVVVNPRNAGNAKSLANEFPGWVTIAADSQAVLDAADTIFVGIHHKLAEEELPRLKFDAGRHSVISLMAIHATAALSKLTRLPLRDVYRAQPLPSVAKHRGKAPHWYQLGGAIGPLLPLPVGASPPRTTSVAAHMENDAK